MKKKPVRKSRRIRHWDLSQAPRLWDQTVRTFRARLLLTPREAEAIGEAARLVGVAILDLRLERIFHRTARVTHARLSGPKPLEMVIP